MPGFGQSVRSIDGYLAPLGFVQLTSLASATGFSAGQIPNHAKLLLVQAESQDVRWRDDGTSPTASVGMIIEPKGILIFNGDFTVLKFIEATASAKLNCSFYG